MIGWYRPGRPMIVAVILSLALARIAQAAEMVLLPPGFVFLRDIDPSIHQDIKYAGSDNFIGRPLPGYDGAECILLLPVAEALAAVRLKLQQRGLSLKTYDCYRPVRAVQAMVSWAQDPGADERSKRFYPHLQKNTLVNLGYIARHSRHSIGDAVDVDLVADAPPRDQSPTFDPNARYGACTGLAEARAPDNGVDMGTGFDCFDPKSYTATAGLTNAQRDWRSRLVAIMRENGFLNYSREWWHFTYRASGATRAYDFPVPQRPG